MNEFQALKIPTTEVARKGIGYLTTQAQDRPVTLTNHGKPVAVVMSPAERDNQRRILKEAELRILEIATALVAGRSQMVSAEEAREQLLAAE